MNASSDECLSWADRVLWERGEDRMMNAFLRGLGSERGASFGDECL